MNSTSKNLRSHDRGALRYLPFACTLVLVVLVLRVQAQQPATPTTQPAAGAPAAPPATQPATAGRKPFNLATTPTLTGDWGGVRTALKDVGFSAAPTLITGYQQNDRGGANTHHAHDVPGIMLYNFELDFDKMKLVPGGSFFIRATQSWNNVVRGDVGSLSTPSYAWGSSGDAEILVDKWWWRQRFLDDKVEIRVGKLLSIVDLFDVSTYAGNMYAQFSNSALTANAALPVSKGIGAFLKVWPTEWLYLQTGAMDPDQRPTRTGFDTAFHGTDHFRGYWELGLTPKFNSAKGKLAGNYRFGMSYDPQSKALYERRPIFAAAPRNQTGDVSFYTGFDQLLWKEKADAKDKQGLGVFGRYGYAHGDVNRVNHFWSLGTQYEGLIPDRDGDVLGFGVAQLMLSEQYRHNVRPAADRETVYELYYAIKVTPWCYLTPDLQVITNPGGDKTGRDSIVGGVRLRILF